MSNETKIEVYLREANNVDFPFLDLCVDGGWPGSLRRERIWRESAERDVSVASGSSGYSIHIALDIYSWSVGWVRRLRVWVFSFYIAHYERGEGREEERDTEFVLIGSEVEESHPQILVGGFPPPPV